MNAGKSARRASGRGTSNVLLYTRELPGGGQVTIEAVPADRAGGTRGRIAVERRCDPRRREGHAPPVIAETSAATEALLFRELYEIASDNYAVARGLLRWKGERRAE